MTEPYYSDDQVTLYEGDSLVMLRAGEVLGYDFELGYEPTRLVPDCSVDAVVTDPPYGIGFMGHEWDQPGQYGPLRSNGTPGPHQRRARVDHHDTTARDGAMEAGRYDLSRPANVLFGEWCEAWARECLRVLKPGGHIIAFGGTRTWHRLACAIEDVGFELRDSMAWLFASGFPKSLDVGKAVDKLDASEERRERALEFTAWMRSTGITSSQINEATESNMGGHYLTAAEQPHVATAEFFDRLRHLLPEVPQRIESLVAERTVESKNYAARAVTGQHDKPAQAAAWRGRYQGTAVAEPTERRDQAHSAEAQSWQGWGTALKPAFEPMVLARKPFRGTVATNVLAHGTGALHVDACRTAMSDADAAAINAKHAGMNPEEYERPPGVSLHLSTNPMPLKQAQAHDLGRWPMNVLLDEATATQLGDPARYFPTFRYEPKAPASERPQLSDGTAHPTVKPLDLMRWCVRLVTPPGGTVLDPFFGSGTTGEACVIEGFACIAFERHEPYLRLATDGRLGKAIQPDIFGAAG